MISPVSTATVPQIVQAVQTSPNKAAEAPAQTSRADARGAFEALAQRYDIRSMTPREIDELAEQLPVNTPDQTAAKMMLLTRGAEFQRHFAETVAEATGAPFGDAERAALELKLDTPIDVIKSFEDMIEMSRRHGGPTEAAEKTLAYLHQFEARRYMPEGGVAV